MRDVWKRRHLQGKIWYNCISLVVNFYNRNIVGNILGLGKLIARRDAPIFID
jgi:hypothetical protein